MTRLRSLYIAFFRPFAGARAVRVAVAIITSSVILKPTADRVW